MDKEEVLIEISTADINDFINIIDLDESVYGYRTRGRFIAESILKDECYIAVLQGKIVGFIILNYTFYENGFIGLLIVDNAYRRMKIGKRLIEHAESKCTTEKLFTSTNQSNLPMQGLLSNCGYIRSGYIDNLDDGDPELVYHKLIKQDK